MYQDTYADCYDGTAEFGIDASPEQGLMLTVSADMGDAVSLYVNKKQALAIARALLAYAAGEL